MKRSGSALTSRGPAVVIGQKTPSMTATCARSSPAWSRTSGFFAETQRVGGENTDAQAGAPLDQLMRGRLYQTCTLSAAPDSSWNSS